ncbi:MAG: hypothetical protein HC933_00510 [Pleurocapsa sp. SU_196_0]|nr:hypothetical protein [Pleurocapsa sp. SU_196_0]
MTAQQLLDADDAFRRDHCGSAAVNLQDLERAVNPDAVTLEDVAGLGGVTGL